MNKLRKKFILAVFVSAAVVFLLTSLLIFFSVKLNNSYREDETTKLILERGGEFAEAMKPGEGRRLFFDFNAESAYRLRFFTVSLENGTAVSADTSNIASVDRENAKELAEHVLKWGRRTGYYQDFRYRFSDDRTTAVFLDCSDDLDDLRSLVLMITLISILFVAMITVVFRFLSKRVMRPFEENSRLQKRFITDASHELKTPLAIIAANAEVLSYKEGENEWVSNILAQVDRSSQLINELLTLSRLDEIETNTDVTDVDLSAELRSVGDEFFEMFRSKNVSVEYGIPDGVTVRGNREQLRRLSSVLVENAAKYVGEGGEFRLTLTRNARNAELRVFNTCELDKDADYSHLFDRFYRPDLSRTSSAGGHGVGLSIAKRIVELHSGSIEAIPESGGLAFRAVIPLKQR